MSQHEPIGSKMLDLLREIVEKSSKGDYIYRGEAENYPKISSTLYREYKKEIDTELFDIEIAQQEMLEQVKAFTSFTDDTDVLTELQHYGGNTNLIDFTTDFLIALFLACDSSYQKDGRIILLNKPTRPDQIKFPKKNLNNRVISQKSIFVQSPSGCIEESEVEIVSIPKELKQAAMEYLKKYHGITTETIYNDLLGYIQNQHKHQTAYAAFYTGYTYFNKGCFENAITNYDKAIRLNPNQLPAAYLNRGAAKDNLGLYEEAIADYDKAIGINPGFAEAYTNRGVARKQLGLYEAAKKDLKQAQTLAQEQGLSDLLQSINQELDDLNSEDTTP